MAETEDEKKAREDREKKEREDREKQEREQTEELGKKSQAELVEYAKSLRTQNKALRTERDTLRADKETLSGERDTFKKTVEDREKKDLADQQKFKELADKERERADKAEKQRQDEAKVSNERYLRAEVRAAAIKAGIHDPKDVDAMDIKDLRLTDDGAIAGIDEFLAARKTEKPHWFKAEGSGGPDNPPQPVPRQGPADPKNGTDWSKVDDKDFDKRIAEIAGTARI